MALLPNLEIGAKTHKGAGLYILWQYLKYLKKLIKVRDCTFYGNI